MINAQHIQTVLFNNARQLALCPRRRFGIGKIHIPFCLFSVQVGQAPFGMPLKGFTVFSQALDLDPQREFQAFLTAIFRHLTQAVGIPLSIGPIDAVIRFPLHLLTRRILPPRVYDEYLSAHGGKLINKRFGCGHRHIVLGTHAAADKQRGFKKRIRKHPTTRMLVHGVDGVVQITMHNTDVHLRRDKPFAGL